MTAYSVNGLWESVQALFADAQSRGKMLSQRTFVAMITASSHCGDIEGAVRVFNEIDNDDIKYDEYVITSFVDCAARNGELEKAMEIIADFEWRTEKRRQ